MSAREEHLPVRSSGFNQVFLGDQGTTRLKAYSERSSLNAS
jgi:hypothetical protein